jgi:hypothetical protein
MNRILGIVIFFLVSFGAQAATCKIEATDKKLAGAALNSFMKKCEADAKAACEKAAAEKKLAGAAKDSNIKKCMSEAVGS